MSDAAALKSPVTIPPSGETALAVLLREEVAAARGYADASCAPGTRRAYAADWAAFLAWCDVRSATSLPADPRVVAVFLATEAARGMAPMSIGRRLAAIGHVHRQNNHAPPQAREGAATLLEVMAGIRRSHGDQPPREDPAKILVDPGGSWG